jgi:putative transposase
LNIRGMAKTGFAKSIHDAGWSAFIDKLAYKAESAGRVLVKVDPRGTSQRCVCGVDVPKGLRQRRHRCGACGLDVDRDHASAMEILRLGLLSLQSVT